MIIETLSTFPDMYASVMGSSMMRIAQEKGILEFKAHDLRDWTHDRHRTTDDDPYGGGDGLVMKCEPIFEAYDDIAGVGPRPTTVFLSPCGDPFTDAVACELSREERLLFVCGHYEGIDERAYALADRVISLGDYVLTSGELASMVVIDAAVRKLPGVLGAEHGRPGRELRRRLVGISPVHASGDVSRHGCAAGAAVGQPRGRSRLAPQAEPRAHRAPATRSARGRRSERGRSRLS